MTRAELIEFCLTFPGAYEDYPFDDLAADNPCTVMRHKQNKKSFAMIMFHGDELYLNLKCDPLEADFLRRVYKSVIPGWHMNKTHWNTIIMGAGSAGDVPGDGLRRMIGNSYDLTKPKVKKKK